jgi:aspartate kinase
MTATENEPRIETHRPAGGLVVMKFGSSSVGGPERIKDVARRLVAAHARGDRVVGVVSAMGRTTEELLSLARRVSPQPDPRELDVLLTVGERIAGALLAMAITDLGPEAVSLTGSQAGIVTDGAHGRARIVEIRAQRVEHALEHGRIVLVAGFQGISSALDLTTLGRGGTDTTAVALAAELGATACEIYTDAGGVYTADPQIVADARKLPVVSYEEMLELSAAGARELALRSVELARNRSVGIHVRSAFVDEPGTWVTAERDSMLEQAIVTAVTYTTEEIVYRVHGAALADLFAALAAEQVNVDTIIQTGPDVIVFSAPAEDRAATGATLDRLGASWSEWDDLGKVSVVGEGMRSHPGIAARTFTALRDAGIEPQFVSTSPIKIAFYVHHEDVERAVEVLHSAFELGGSAKEGRAEA